MFSTGYEAINVPNGTESPDEIGNQNLCYDGDDDDREGDVQNLNVHYHHISDIKNKKVNFWFTTALNYYGVSI